MGCAHSDRKQQDFNVSSILNVSKRDMSFVKGTSAHSPSTVMSTSATTADQTGGEGSSPRSSRDRKSSAKESQRPKRGSRRVPMLADYDSTKSSQARSGFFKLNQGHVLEIFSYLDCLQHYSTISSLCKTMRSITFTQKYWQNLILKDEGIKLSPVMLRTVISNLKRLRSLQVMSPKPLVTGQITIIDLLKSISAERMETLTIKGVKIDKEALYGVCNMIILGNRIKRIELIDTGMTAENLQQFALSLPKKNSIEHIELSGNDFSTGYDLLMKKIADISTMKTLILKDNKINHEGSKALVKYLVKCPNINHIDLSKNRIGRVDGGGIEFGHLIRGNPSLRYLNVSHNELKRDVLSEIGTALENGGNLEALIIAGNEFDDDSTHSFFKKVSTMRKLKNLDFSYNYLANMNQKILSHLLKDSRLEELSLEACEVDFFGTRSLAKTLALTRRLKHLNLSKNKIEALALSYLFSAFNSHSKTHLTSLDLSGNSFGRESLPILKKVMNKRSRPFREICLNGNNLRKTDVNDLVSSLQSARIECNILASHLVKCNFLKVMS